MEEFFSKFTHKGLPGGPNELKAFTEGFITSSEGQWAYPGMNTLIPNAGGRITMQGVNYPVLGIDDLGNQMMMQPGGEYQFPGDSVYEIPMKKGGLVKMPKLTKKNKKSYNNKFSSSISATSRLFTESELFAKPKSKKKKIFDPNAKYQDGGENMCEDGRCEETDQAQELLDQADKLRYKNVDLMWDVVNEVNPEGQHPGNAAAVWKKHGAGTLANRLGIENPANCMWAAGSGYQCLPETKGKMPLTPFESNDKFLNAVSSGKIPFRRVALTSDPQFDSPETAMLRPGDIINIKGGGRSHAMTFSHYLEDGTPIYLDSNGEAMDFDWNRGMIPGMTPGKNGVKAYVNRLDPEALNQKELSQLEEKARTNPTMVKETGGEYEEVELTEEEIEEYRRGGWIVEEIDTYKKGGEPKKKKRKTDDYGRYRSEDGNVRTPITPEMQAVMPAEEWGQYVQEVPEVYTTRTKEQQEAINAARNNQWLSRENYKRAPHLYLPDGSLRPQAAEAADWVWQLGMTGPAAIKGVNAAMKIPLGAGVNVGNVLNAGMLAHGATEVDDRYQDWQDVAEGNMDWKEAALKTGMTALELSPAYGAVKQLSSASKTPSMLLGSPNAPIMKSGMPNPLELADAIVPNLDPLQVTTANSLLDLSPLNIIPIGKQLGTKGNAYRKFGNTMKYVQESKSLSPKGGILPRMGKQQIEAEGNWAALNEPWEKYPGTFTAEFDFKAPGSNLGYSNPSSRAGVLITDASGKALPEIPLTDPGLSFHRRLPFSNRYIPIDKQKLIDNKFQMATQGSHLQSLAEKYGYGLAYAGLLGAMGNDNAVKKYNKYTIDPVINEAKKIINGPKDFKYDNGGGVNFQTYEQQLRQLENSVKAGYRGGKWYPHDSVEGGNKTIGYGHKLSGKENYSKGLTTAQVLALQKKDLVKHTNIAKSMVDNKYGAGTFDRLPESRKVLLVDYAYNGVLHEFPNFMRATVKGDKAGMLKEYKRYTGSKPLTQRNEWTRSVIEGSNVGTAKTNTPKTLPAKTAPKKQPVKQPVKKPIAQPKFSSNETFSYDYRPDAVYRVADGGDWYINAGKDTHNEFIKLNDPTGKRTETLRKFAHINEVPLDQILNRINNSGNYDSRIDLGYFPE